MRRLPDAGSRLLRCVVAGCALGLTLVNTTFAQAPAAPQPAGVQTILRSIWPEAAITAGLMVLCLYAVCRRSGRQ